MNSLRRGECVNSNQKNLDKDTIKEGDDILLFLNNRKNFLVKIKQDTFHTHKGYIKLDNLIGEFFGSRVKTQLGTEFTVLKPTIFDHVRKMGHATQIVYPEDAALIVRYAGIGPGSRVVEAGTGSGALTSVLAHFIKPTGCVYSYEIRPEFKDRAEKNISRAGLLEWVVLKTGDITLGIEEIDVDSIVLDMATPWLVVENAYNALKGSGCLVSFSPTIEQVIKMVEALEKSGFVNIETVESIVRRIKVKKGETRPETLMIGHTGYLTHARKAEKSL